MSAKTLLITGCSSGIGETCARGMKARGWRVFATARKPEDIARLAAEGLEAFYLDYAEPASIEACVAEVASRTGGKLDALFNNGAYGQPGAVEDLTRATLEAQFQANVFGWHDLTRQCLPLIRANGSGRVVQCSSVLGIVALKWRGAYNASKFAIEALSDTMRLELKPFNIAVVIIEPGPISSKFIVHALEAFDRNIGDAVSHYRDVYVQQRKRLQKTKPGRFKLPPEAVLEKLVHALESPRPKIRYTVTTPTLVMTWCKRLLPLRMLDRVADKASD